MFFWDSFIQIQVLSTLLKSSPKTDNRDNDARYHNRRHIRITRKSHDNDPQTKNSVYPMLPHRRMRS